MRALLSSLCLLVPCLAVAETPVDKAQALLAAKDCDQLLLSFENARPKGGGEDLGLARVLGQAASGPCASDKVVAFSLGTAAARLAPKDPEVLMAAASAARGAGMNGEAAELLDKAITAAPSEARPRVARAELALAEQEAATALRVLEPVKGSGRAQALYQQAQKAQRASSSEQDQLRKGEERAMKAAAKAMVSGARTERGAAASGEEGEVDLGGGRPSGSAGAAFHRFGIPISGHKSSLNVRLKKGRVYRVQATGTCWNGGKVERLSGSDQRAVVGVDLHLKIGRFEHGLDFDGTERTEDFDFTAEAADSKIQVWNASLEAARANCSISELTITER